MTEAPVCIVAVVCVCV